jgi:quercetin dioxygenase-like cupin family protein
VDGVTVHRNPAAGETLTVHPVENGLLHAELVIEPVHHAPPAHAHPRAAERFTVVSGAIRLRLGRTRRLLEEGESALAPAGVVHGYEGVPGTPARVLVELDPAGRMADFFADVYGADPARRDPRTGTLRLRTAAGVLRRYPHDITVPRVPRLLLALLDR